MTIQLSPSLFGFNSFFLQTRRSKLEQSSSRTKTHVKHVTNNRVDGYFMTNIYNSSLYIIVRIVKFSFIFYRTRVFNSSNEIVCETYESAATLWICCKSLIFQSIYDLIPFTLIIVHCLFYLFVEFVVYIKLLIIQEF